jgi:hypothetical protein
MSATQFIGCDHVVRRQKKGRTAVTHVANDLPNHAREGQSSSHALRRLGDKLVVLFQQPALVKECLRVSVAPP